MEMRQALCTAVESQQAAEGEVTAPHKTIATPLGPVFLQDCCPPALVESLRAASGLRAFARLPEREHALLLRLAQRPDCSLALAYTPGGEIIGQVTLAPGEGWWEGLTHTYEVAVEVCTDWRQLGIARRLLTLVLAQGSLEHCIVLGMGLSWHWDTDGLGISRFRYRKLLARLLASYSFVEYLTAEGNICMDPANILLARLGSRVEQVVINKFYERLLQSETLPGL